MKISDKHILCLLAVVMFVTGYSLSLNSGTNTAATSDKVGYVGIPCIQVTRANGEVEPQLCTHNIITTLGKNWIKEMAMGSGAPGNNWTRIAIGGNSSPLAVGDATLGGIWNSCGLANVTGTMVAIGTGNWSIQNQWTSSCDNSYVNTTGIYNYTTGAGAASGNLLAEAYWSPNTNLMNGDKLNVTYYTWVA